MSETISKSIGKLSSLQTFIVFSWKNIGTSIPSSISILSALTHLSLDNKNSLLGGVSLFFNDGVY